MEPMKPPVDSIELADHVSYVLRTMRGLRLDTGTNPYSEACKKLYMNCVTDDKLSFVERVCMNLIRDELDAMRL